MSPQVTIVVLNWNNATDTIACLQSLNQVDYPIYSMIVIDNGSTDDSAERITAAHPHVTLLRSQVNLGYAGGNNMGIRHALALGAEYVCILNNDVVVAPGFLTALVAEAEADPNLGIAGPKMYFFEPANMIFAAGSFVHWANGELEHRGMHVQESDRGFLFSTGPEDVDFIVGCCLLASVKAIEQVGLLDERYFLNFEDVEWCVRMRQVGYSVRYTPRSLVWHRVSASLGQASPTNTYYMVRNSLLFFWTHLEGCARRRAILRIVLRNMMHLVAWSIQRDPSGIKRQRRAATVTAIADAASGRFGPMTAKV